MSVSASASPVHRHKEEILQLAVQRHNDMLRRENGASSLGQREMGTFETYDVDHDGYLGSKEAQTLLQDMDVDPAMWHLFAGSKDKLITRLAFERIVDDSKLFQKTDKDASDHLEPGEIQDLENQAGISKKSTFNWRTFDRDKDSKLSKAEFLLAGPAAARAAAQALAGGSVSLLSTDGQVADKEWKQEQDAGAEADGWAWTTGDDTPGENIDLDMDASLMEETEQDMLDEDDDEDERGLSFLEEYNDDEDEEDDDLREPLHPEDHHEEGESLLQEDEQAALDYLMNDDLDLGVEDERKVASELFQAFDTDNNGVLDGSEIQQVLDRAGVANFDWRAYDRNHDNRLTQDEFYSMGSDAENKDNPDLMDGILAQLYEEPDDGLVTENARDSSEEPHEDKDQVQQSE